MSLTSYFRGLYEAAVLPLVPVPKAPKQAQAYPGYRTQITQSASPIAKPNVQSATLDRALTARQTATDYDTLKVMTKNSPELSSAISLQLRTGIPDSYTIFGRNMDGVVDREITGLANELLRRLTYLGNVDGTFGPQQGLQSLSETLALDLLQTGAMCGEVALDKQLVPASLNPIAVKTLVFYEDGKTFTIKQRVGGEEIDLDLPTVIYVTQDQSVTDAYPTSPMSSAIQPVLSDLDFNNSMRRALLRAVLPRLQAVINSEKVKKDTPADILADPDRYAAYKNSIVSSIENVVNGLNPEDALVSFDVIEYSYIDGGHDPSAIIERVQKVMNAKLAAGGKTLPVALGFASTSNASSSESLLYLKQAGSIRKKLNEFYSRALTMAVRLMGYDGYVEFRYDELDLRPSNELEAFRSMRQKRYLELLSFGFITDDEAGLELTGNLPPQGFKPLSGTQFLGATGAAVADPTGNASSNTSAMGQALKPSTPSQPKK